MKANERIGQHIRMWRMLNGIKLEVLARQLGMSKASLSQIENGKRDLTLSKVEVIAAAMQRNVDELFRPATVEWERNGPSNATHQ